MEIVLLLAHLLSAFGSMAYATYLFFFPSRKGIRMAYSGVGLTIGTGIWLIFASRVPIGTVCITGLLYLGYVSTALVISSKKLALVRARQ